MERRSTDPEEGREDARLSGRCEAKREEWTKHWQCDESVQNLEDTLWTNEELTKIRGSLTKAKRVRFGKGFEILRDEHRSGMRRLPPKSSLGIDKKKQEEKWWSYWKRWNRVGSGRNRLARRCSS